MTAVPFARIGGRFYRAVLAHRVAHVLDPPGPVSAGRYHRPGQAALYLTPEPDWAAIAVGGYQAEDGLERMIVPLELAGAQLLDQRDEAACAALGIDRELSNVRWRPELEAGREPPSWRNADAARAAGVDGIVDRSRGIVGGWHITLFRWNGAGAPQVRVAGPAVPCDYAAARARWAAPPGWNLPVFR